MFHGLAFREGIESPHEPNVVFGEPYREPLHIVRNAYVVPDIFLPSAMPIIGERVKAAISSLPNLEFLRVIIDKLIYHPFDRGDLSQYQRGRRHNPIKVLKQMDGEPSLIEKYGSYFELIVPVINRLTSARTDRKTVRFRIGPPGFQEPFKVKVSKGLLEEYPIIFSEGGFLCSDKAFDRLGGYLDPDYFTTTHVEL